MTGLRAGDRIVVEHRPDHGVTVSHLFRALTTERHLQRDLQAVLPGMMSNG